MKSLKEFTMGLTEPEYHAYPAWSHSLISRYAREGFSSIATIHEPIKTTPSMEFGSFFDCMITRPMDLDKEYVVSDTIPAPKEKEVFDYILENYKGTSTLAPFDELPMSVLQEAIDATGYYGSTRKFETKIEYLDKVKDYYNNCVAGKNIVSSADWADAAEMKRNLYANKFIGGLFGRDEGKGIEYIYQPQFLINYKTSSGTVKLKIMIDLLIVNHNEKTVRLVDLKTSSMPAYDFAQNFLKFRYDLESSVYTDVLEAVMKQHKEYEGYKILPFVFVDVSRTDKIPVAYEYDPRSDSQLFGFSYSVGDRTYSYKHWTTLLNEMVEYEEKNAVVPDNINVDEANDILSLINK